MISMLYYAICLLNCFIISLNFKIGQGHAIVAASFDGLVGPVSVVVSQLLGHR